MCYGRPVARSANRVNIVLDEARALKLRKLAERTNTNPGTIARSLLSTALDEADPDPRTITALLDGIDGAWDRAMSGAVSAIHADHWTLLNACREGDAELAAATTVAHLLHSQDRLLHEWT